jgi:SAM-dependent methyltransferase
MNIMPGRLEDDPLTPEERDEFEGDLISFSDRELDLLGDIRGLDVLYAGGSSLLWLEGLSQRVGEGGSVTALDIDEENLERAWERLEEAVLPAPVRLVFGDVFDASLEPGAFDLAYSAGLFHELDVREELPEEALAKLGALVRPGGRISTSDYVDIEGDEPSTDLEWERMDAETVNELSGARYYGIGPPERLVELHERVLTAVRWRISPPHEVRHLDKIMLSEPDEPPGFALLPDAVASRLRARREALFERIRREGYTRPATLYVEGVVPGENRTNG